MVDGETTVSRLMRGPRFPASDAVLSRYKESGARDISCPRLLDGMQLLCRELARRASKGLKRNSHKKHKKAQKEEKKSGERVLEAHPLALPAFLTLLTNFLSAFCASSCFLWLFLFGILARAS